ncbi:MAG: hypothetical protein LBV54_07830, partial [Puniceicoccales bacterium]|nr:hypothetical protein [Puniceicoccales bacterium]
LNNQKTWLGVKVLDDEQLNTFSKALVEMIRNRLNYLHPVRYEAPGVSKLCRPFFSLAEFVNRGADPAAEQGDNQKLASKLGVIQAALFLADKNKAGINNSAGRTLQKGVIGNLERHNDRNIGFADADSIHFPTLGGDMVPIATNAPSTILQADILQAIGSRLTARSDTFIIRAYGDVSDITGTRTNARAILEAVVQRTPEYCDPRDNADVAPGGGIVEKPGRNETGGSLGRHGYIASDLRDDGGTNSEYKINRKINLLLGRRFQIISVRWLSPNEI